MDEVGYRVGLPTQGLQVVSVNPGHALPLLCPLSRENLPLLGRTKQQEEVTCRTGEVLQGMQLARGGGRMYSRGLRDYSSHFTTEKMSMHKSWKQKGILLRTHRPVCVPYTCTCVREYEWLWTSLHP